MTDNALKKNSEIFNALMSEFDTLTTFSQVKEWKTRAEPEIEQILSLVRALNMQIAEHTQSLDRLKYEQSKKTLGRLFGGGEDKELTQQVEALKEEKIALEKLALQLRDSIDFTPSSAEQQKSLSRELRQQKKEIQEKKREITTVIRSTRPVIGEQDEPSAFDRATIERRKARYARDAELLPQETTSASYARQIAKLDTDILRVEKLTE